MQCNMADVQVVFPDPSKLKSDIRPNYGEGEGRRGGQVVRVKSPKRVIGVQLSLQRQDKTVTPGCVMHHHIMIINDRLARIGQPFSALLLQ
jgi:hypothetical protein